MPRRINDFIFWRENRMKFESPSGQIAAKYTIIGFWNWPCHPDLIPLWAIFKVTPQALELTNPSIVSPEDVAERRTPRNKQYLQYLTQDIQPTKHEVPLIRPAPRVAIPIWSIEWSKEWQRNQQQPFIPNKEFAKVNLEGNHEISLWWNAWVHFEGWKTGHTSCHEM